MVKRYGLLKYNYTEKTKTINLGDYIQSLSAKQFLPRVDYLVDRESLREYVGEKILMILNGWYMLNDSFPPSLRIGPLWISLHIDRKKILTPKTISYLKKHEPIGCRDNMTRRLLYKNGIKAYFSGCLTLTLKNEYADCKREGIYFVDVAENAKTKWQRTFYKKRTENELKKYLSKDDLNNVFYLTHKLEKSEINLKDSFKKAEKLIEKYSKARLVVTSRIHAALPCLALGTPVIFVNDLGNDKRFDGLIELLNCIVVKAWRVRSNIKTSSSQTQPIVNSDDYKTLIPNLEKSCVSFIQDYPK